MKEKDAAQVSRRCNLAAGIHELGVVFGKALPVQGIIGPGHDPQAELPGNFNNLAVLGAIGRSEENGIGAKGTQDVISPAQLLCPALYGNVLEVWMRKGMACDLMSLFHHTADNIGVMLGVFTEHEEGGRYLVGIKHVEKVWRVHGGAVVKGNGAEVFSHALAGDLCSHVRGKVGR